MEVCHNVDAQGTARAAGYAAYLDYRPLAEEERPLVEPVLERVGLRRDLEARALSHAVTEVVPRHFEEIRCRKEELVLKTTAASPSPVAGHFTTTSTFTSAPGIRCYS